MSKLSDCYQTPQWLFDLLDKEFNFLIDVCTDSYKGSELETFNAKKDYYLSDAKDEWFPQIFEIFHEAELLTSSNGRDPDNLDEVMSEYSIFMNPPYSDPGPYLERAWEFSKYMRVVCLVRDDPSTNWYQNLIQYAGSLPSHVLTTYWVSKDCPLMHKELRKNHKLHIIRLPERLRFEASFEMLREDYLKDNPSHNVQSIPKTTKNFRPTEDGRIECKNVYNFPCCIMIMDRRG